MTAFAEATRLAPDGDRFRADVPDGWQQGKGAFGGVVIGIMTRALVAARADADRSLRALSADLYGPLLPGPAHVRVETARRGNNVSFLDAQLEQNGERIARASATFARARDARPSGRVAMPPPEVRPWLDTPVLEIGPPFGPVFAVHYEYRSAGPLPFSGGSEPLALGWVREKSLGPRDEAAVVALLDSFWPTVFALESGPRPMTTVGYTMQLLCDPATLPPEEPLAYRARAVATHGNFFVELRELWHGTAPVALNQQTFAILK